MIAQGEGEVEEMIPELPQGFFFAPTDDELINFYLARKIAGLTVPPYIIATSNVFETEPWKLPIDGFRYGNGNEAYYFARRTQKGSRVNRQAGGGTWKATGSDKPVKNHHGLVVGYKLHLTYYYPHGSNEASNWILHEYRFGSKDNSNPKPKFEEWVVCRIKHKTGKKETHHQGGGGGGEGAHNLAVEVNQSAGLLCPPVSEMPVVAESTALALHHPNPSNDDDQGREQQMMDDGFQTGADMQLPLQLPDPDECVWDGDYWDCILEELMQSPIPATADDHQGSSSLELDKEDGPQAKRLRLNAPPIPDSALHPSPITCLTPPMDMEGNDIGILPFETTNHTTAAAAGVLPQSPHLYTANEAWSMDKVTITDHTAADAGLLVQSPGWKVPLFGYQAIDPPLSLLGF